MYRLVSALVFLLLVLSCSSDPAVQRDEFFESGQKYLAEGKLEEARIQFLNALKADDRHNPSRLALAEVYQKSGSHPLAIAEFRRVLESEPGNIQANLKLGRYYLAAGIQESKWFEEVKQLAEAALKTEPGNVEAQILLGNAYAGLQDFDHSIEALQQALQNDPDNLEAYLNIGASRFGQKQPEEAEKAFLEAVNRHPDAPNAHLGLGNFYAFSGDFAKAEGSFRKAFELAPENDNAVLALLRLYLSQKNPQAAVAVLEQSIALSKNPIPRQIALANFHVAQGQPELARELLERLHSEVPQDRAVALRLAELKLSAKDTQEAIALVDGVLATNPNDGEAHFLRGQLSLVSEDFEAAAKEIDEAIRLSPLFLPSYLAKTDLLQRQGKLAEAEATVRKALEVDRSNLQARGRLAKLLAVQRKSQTNLETALADAEAILAEAPNNVDARVARGEAAIGLKRLDVAKEDFKALLEIAPDNPFYLHRLGIVAAMEKKPDEALSFFRRALAVNAGLTDVINDLVVVLVEQGRRQDALAEIDRLAATAEKQTPFALLKGRVYLSTKDYARAEAEFRKAITENPDNSEPYLLLGQTMLAQNRYQDAVREVDALIAKSPNLGNAHLLRAFYLDAAKDQQGAMAGYRKALEVMSETDSGYAPAANNLAWLLAVTGGSLTEARTLAQKARERNPENASFADTLGWIHYLMGNYVLAVDQLLYSVNQGNQQAQHYFRLGMAYFKNDQRIQAKQALRRALELNPSFDGAAEANRALQEIG